MGSWGDDIGLLYLVLLNAAVLMASWRLARRRSADALDAAGDALLLFYLVQYLSVCLCGLAGAMHALTIGLVALLLSAFLALGSWRIERSAPRRNDDRGAWLARLSRAVTVGAMLFVAGYVATLVYHQRLLPVIANDAITYHLPAAAQWLQSGRLQLYEAWYYNPANSFSPLAGSVFMAWLMAPMQNDSIARFVAVGPMMLLMIGVLNLSRRVGAGAGGAALIAAACVLARPFASQAILAKDDLFVAAFFVIAVDALSRDRLSTRWGPWRAGIAIGLLLATKFTVLLSLPLLLLMVHRGWTMRRLLIIASVACSLAGGWYVRNVWLTGNPLYPSDVTIGGVTIFRGMMDVARSRLLTTPAGVWEIFAGGYYGLTTPIAIVLMIAWVKSVVCVALRSGNRLADPVVRTCVVGPAAGIAIFVFSAPYGEMRFAYPSVALLFVCVAIALSRLSVVVQWIVAATLMIFAGLTAFRPDMSGMFVGIGVAAGLAAAGIALMPRRAANGVALAGGVTLTIGLAMFAYVQWPSYVREVDDAAAISWSARYGEIADVWKFVRDDDNVPRGATIAYANTFFTYPLMGFRYEHRVVHVPTRSDIERFDAMPHLPRKVSGEQLVTEIVAMLRENPDRDAWLGRLRESGGQFLVIGKYDPAAPDRKIVPPELVFAEADPQRFVRVFDNEAGSVFRIVW